MAQINDYMPRTYGDSFIHVDDIDAFVESSRPLCALKKPIVTDLPFRRPRGLNAQPSRAFALASGASLAVLVVALGIGLRAGADVRTPFYHALAEAKRDRPPLRSTCSLSSSPVPQPASVCTAGDSTSRRQIILWGDSYAEHLEPLVAVEATARSVAVLWTSGCPRPMALKS